MNRVHQVTRMSSRLVLLSLLIPLSLGCDNGNSGEPADTSTNSDSATSTDTNTDGTDSADGGIPPATLAQKENICGCLHKTLDISESAGWIKESCIESISDKCVYCVDGKTEGKDCEELEFGTIGMSMLECAPACPNVFSAPENVAKCEDIVHLYPVGVFFNKDPEFKEYYGHCMCTNCFDEYSECIVNPACMFVMVCFMCEKCPEQPFCAKLIESAETRDTISIGLAKRVGECAKKYNSCIPPFMFDGGTADSGAL